MKLTAPQQQAIDALRAGHYCKSSQGRNIVSTGLNTRVLSSLQDKGLIDCSQIYLGGFVCDLVVHDEVLEEEYRRVRLGYGL